MLVVSVLLVLVNVPFMAPAQAETEASGASPEPTAQTVTLAEQRQLRAERRKQAAQERLARKRAEREALAQKRRREREERSGTRSTAFGHVVITCKSVTWFFENFPNAPGNTVSEMVSIDGGHQFRETFTFDGPSGSNTTLISPTPGLHRIDARANWNTNGLVSRWDITSKRTCGREPSPGFSIEKRQSLAGSGEGFVPTPLIGEVGQTVNYQIVVTNTGSITLKFSNFEDPHCDPGTISGGGSGILEPGAATKYTCQHLITAADLAAGSYSNVATITGTGATGPITHTSNTVVVTVVAAPAVPGGQTTTSSSPTGASGTLPFTASLAGRGGVLGSSARVPALTAPQGCVRGSFLASIKSNGVQRATFYLDKRRLKTLTSKNARKGKLTIRINVRRVKVGPHRVLARITMKPTAASVRAVVASRSRTIVVCRSSTLRPKFTG
jgi:hypothetical protein